MKYLILTILVFCSGCVREQSELDAWEVGKAKQLCSQEGGLYSVHHVLGGAQYRIKCSNGKYIPIDEYDFFEVVGEEVIESIESEQKDTKPDEEH